MCRSPKHFSPTPYFVPSDYSPHEREDFVVCCVNVMRVKIKEQFSICWFVVCKGFGVKNQIRPINLYSYYCIYPFLN